MDYEEPDFMDFHTEMEAKTPENNWKLVGSNPKLRPHKEATQTPLPASPERRNKLQGAPDITRIMMATTKVGPTATDQGNASKSETEFENEHLQVEENDGTLRITVRWRPTKYQELLALAVNTQWNYEATDLVQFILGTATGAVLYPWKTEPGVVPPIPFIDLTPDHLPDYIGVKTPSMSPAKTFICFRLCLTAAKN
jgi:hypothetical protein